MTVNISKQLLGMACIIAGAFIPLILCTLNWLPSGFDPLEAAEFIHLTTPLLLTVMAITVLVNVRESSEARGTRVTSLEQLPRNAATLLTGAVGMLLLFTYLIEATNPLSRISPAVDLFVYAMTGTVPLMEAAGSQGPRSYRFSAQRVRPTSRRKPGGIHWGSYRRNLDGSEPRYYLSNAPEDTPLETLAYVGGSRWRIETEFETEKSDVGLDEYETRTWAGWHHHVALCLLAGAFLLSLQQDWGERCPGSPGPKSTGWCGKCCPGNGSGRMSCCGGWRRRKNATNGPGAPMPSAEPPGPRGLHGQPPKDGEHRGGG